MRASRAAVRRARSAALGAARSVRRWACCSWWRRSSRRIRWSERRQAHAFVAARLAEADPAIREVRGPRREGRRRARGRLRPLRRGDRPAAKLAGVTRSRSRRTRVGRLRRGERAARPRAGARSARPVTRAPAPPTRVSIGSSPPSAISEPDVARDLGARLAQLDDDGSRRARLAAARALARQAPRRPARASCSTASTSMPTDVASRTRGARHRRGVRWSSRPAPTCSRRARRVATPRGSPSSSVAPRTSNIEIPLPPAAAVPPGFVFVPGGTSLLGAADVEGVRRRALRGARARGARRCVPHRRARGDLRRVPRLPRVSPGRRTRRTPPAHGRPRISPTTATASRR